MIETKKIIFLFMLVIFFQTSFAQFDGLQINLEISSVFFTKKGCTNLRISLYQEDPVSFFLSIKERCPKYIDYETWLKRDADTIIKINKDDFNRISEQSMNLSSSMILKGTNPSNAIIGTDGIGVNLEIVASKDNIIYGIWSPDYNTKERNLEPYLALCKEILKLAKIKPKDWFL